jgi:transcriptional regulator with XRE-family HTH domain
MAAMALPLPESVAGRIRYARKMLKGWSQRELAEETARIGYPMTEPQIQRIEAGQRPDIGQLLILSIALRLTIYQLGATEDEYPEVQLFADAGWDPLKYIELFERSQRYEKRARHLQLVPSSIGPAGGMTHPHDALLDPQ